MLWSGGDMVQFEKLSNKPFFTTQEAFEEGITRRMLSYYVQKGELERVSKGIYRCINLDDSVDLRWAGLVTSANQVNGGIICLVSALIYYEITDDFMNEYWVAIPHSHSKVDLPSTRFVRVRNSELGVEEIELCNMKVKIFDVERTIIDSFRLLDIETALKALKLYMTGHCGRPDIGKMTKYMKELRCDISKYMMPFTV